MDVRHVCEHAGDCSVWTVNPATSERSNICDCGVLRIAVKKIREDEVESKKDLLLAWGKHLKAIDKSMGF